MLPRVLLLVFLTLSASSLACAPSEERAEAARERFDLALVDGDMRFALEALEDLKATLPDTPESKLELASRLGRAGEMSQAVWLLDEATQRYPDHTGLRMGLAEGALFIGDSALALRALEPISAEDSRAPNAAVLRARAQIALGDLETGLATLERAEARYPDQFFRLRVARFEALCKEKSFDLALALLDDARSREDLSEPQRSWVELRRADVLAAAGETETALQELAVRLDQRPDDSEARTRRVAILIQEGRADEAADELTRALEANPDSVELYPLLASAERARGDDASAEAALRERLARDPSPTALATLADYLHQAGRSAEGAALLGEAVAKAGERASAELSYLHVAMLLTAGDEESASEQFDEFRRRYPRNPRVDYLRARFELERGDTDAAVHRLKQVASRLDRSDVQHWLGIALELQGDYEAAEFRYGLATARNPSQISSYLGLVRTFERRAMWRQVLHYAGVLVHRSPGDALGYDYAVRAMLAMGQLDAAEAGSRLYVERFPDLPEPRLLLAQTLRTQGRSQEALTVLEEALQRNPDEPQLIAERAVALSLAGRSDEGLRTLDEALSRHEDDASLHRGRAYLMFVSDRREQARGEVERALELNPGDPSPLQMMGDFFSMRGDFAHAVPAYERYLERRPHDASVLFRLAIALERTGDAAAAIAVYRRAAVADDQALAPRNNLALLLEREGRLDEALEAAQEAYAVSASEPAVMDTLGWLYFLRGKPERAVALLEKARKGAPGDAEIRLHLALAYRESGQTLQAQELLKELHEQLDPSHELYRQVDEAVASPE